MKKATYISYILTAISAVSIFIGTFIAHAAFIEATPALIDTATTTVSFMLDTPLDYVDTQIVPLSVPKDLGIGAFMDKTYKIVCYTKVDSISCVKL